MTALGGGAPLTPGQKLALFGDGPWMFEPDFMEFEASGLRCQAWRNPRMGFWCGYVGLTKSHPLWGVHYDDALLHDIYAHGGLTFAGKHDHGEDDLWWIGFDCGHSRDLMPFSREFERRMRESEDPEARALGAQLAALKAMLPSIEYLDEYRDLAYVQRQCAELAAQLAAAGMQRMGSHTFCRGCKRTQGLLWVELAQGPRWLCGRCRAYLRQEQSERWMVEVAGLGRRLGKRTRRDSGPYETSNQGAGS